MPFDDVYFRSHHTRLGGGAGSEGRRSHFWPAALAGTAGPIAATALLPDPRGQFALLSDPRADVVMGGVATLVATGAAYLLLIWAAAIVLSALAGRAPGALGRAGRRVLLRITPALVRQIVVTAAGLSLASGLAACGGQSTAPISMTALPASVQQSILSQPAQPQVQAVAFTVETPRTDPGGVRASPGSDPDVRPGAPGPRVELTVDLDWPVSQAASESATARTAPPPTPPSMTTTSSTSQHTPTAAAVDRAPADRAQIATSQHLPGQASATVPRSIGPDGVVVVHRGDSLWSIAAAHLPPDAGAAQVDAAWHAWYQANLEVIGPDPGLILPGQQLHAPAAHSAPGESGAATHHPPRPLHGGMR